MDVEPAVCGRVEDARGDEEADGDGDDEVYGAVAGRGQLREGQHWYRGMYYYGIWGGATHVPACKCVSHVDVKVELVCQHLDRHCGAVSTRLDVSLFSWIPYIGPKTCVHVLLACLGGQAHGWTG